MIANKVYTREEMREERIHTADYCFIAKAGEYTATLIMKAEFGNAEIVFSAE